VGDNAQARALYERAAGTRGRVGLAQELARCLLGHAALLVRDAHEDAGDVLDRAERTAEEIDARETLMRLGLLRAKRALASCSAPDPHLGVVLGRAAEHEPPLDRISRLSLLAEFHEKSENPDKARRIIHETIGLATELGLPPVLADLHHRLGTLLESMGLASEAGAMHERAVREIERLRGSFGSDRFRAAFLGDRERIIRSAAEQDQCNMLRGLVTHAKDRGITVLGEGVETLRELDMLREMGVELIQGWVVAKPALEPVREFDPSVPRLAA